MMKKILFCLGLFVTGAAFSQDTTKVDQYCQLVASTRMLSTKVTIDIDYGEERKFFGKDTRLKDDEGKLKKINGIVDALNYMGRNGWVLVNAFPSYTTNNQIYHYILKKTFAKADEQK
jgi:hypothetical protein